MKKLFLTVMSIATFTIYAQDVTFGAKAGLNFANLDVTDSNYDSRTSFHLGITAEFAISDNFSVQPELLYSAQGAKDEFSDSDYYGDGSVRYSEESILKVDYLQIPIMGKYYVSDAFSIEVGPQIGFLLSSKYEGDFTFTDNINGEVLDSGSDNENYKDFTKSVDFGLNFGLGYKLESGLNFALRYNLGLSDINDIQDSTSETKNRVLQLSVGFNF